MASLLFEVEFAGAALLFCGFGGLNGLVTGFDEGVLYLGGGGLFVGCSGEPVECVVTGGFVEEELVAVLVFFPVVGALLQDGVLAGVVAVEVDCVEEFGEGVVKGGG